MGLRSYRARLFKARMADTPAPGNTINVPAGANFQAVLNNANCGDTIQLQAGATFTGLFTLPAKNCDDSNWIIIRTSAPDYRAARRRHSHDSVLCRQ